MRQPDDHRRLHRRQGAATSAERQEGLRRAGVVKPRQHEQRGDGVAVEHRRRDRDDSRGRGHRREANTGPAADAVSEGTDLVVARGPIAAPAPTDPVPLVFYVVAAAVAILLVFGPPALALALRRRREEEMP